ncbi:hypothetical protein [Kutzneria kofuensis]|uniref:Uncharacterized protein n=1 Tax=Kutzneria kofuensis TaxID=103725 RepID=A0A7W9KE19_9PSEU|nr:hypothetical protein [Kutzneria kofuensis]MBB5890740.1 hypothetical protein [Kutzneria kofuensis]
MSISASTAARQSAQSADGQPSLVEDFSYPGADKILADRGIKLISGDGHLLLVDCVNVATLIEVHASSLTDHSNDPGHYCFKVNGASGDLKLELTDAYQVKGDSHNVQAKVSVDGQSSTVNVDKNRWTGIGVGADSHAATLLELKASS